MSEQWQIRRGTTVENDDFTGAEGEITMDTDKKQLRVHDGSTQGGAGIIDPIVAFQVPTANNGYKWYRKYRSGWVEQGGPGNTMNQTIVFPTPMADTNYYTNLGFVIANYGAQNITRYTDRIVTSSSAQNSCTYGGWYVCGMAA